MTNYTFEYTMQLGTSGSLTGTLAAKGFGDALKKLSKRFKKRKGSRHTLTIRRL